MSTTIAASLAPAEQLELGLAGLRELAGRLFAGDCSPARLPSDLPTWPAQPTAPNGLVLGMRVRKAGVALLLGLVLAPHTMTLTSVVLGAPARPSLAPTVGPETGFGIPQSTVFAP